MSKLYPKNGHIYLENGAYRTWSSDGRPVNLMPLAQRRNVPLTVSFPDFQKRNAYTYDIYTRYIGSVPVSTQDACASWVTILPQEWVSGDTILAPMLAGCNFLDVRVTISRTKSPTKRLAFEASNLVPTQQTFLPGGSCPCEEGGIWWRGFEIVVAGANIVLRRRQTVYDGPSGIPWRPGNSVYQNGVPAEGWTYGGGSNAQNGHLAQMIQGKSGGSIGKHRGGSNACSLADNTDFSSIWTGTVQLWPGYIAA